MGITIILRRYITKGKEEACKANNKNKKHQNSKKENAEKLFNLRKNKEKYCGSKNDVEFASMVRVLD